MGEMAQTATLLSAGRFNSKLRGGGFANVNAALSYNWIVSDLDRKQRAEERRLRMVITRCKLEDSDIDPNPTFGAEAISLAAMLSRQAWAFSRRPFPTYARDNIPVRFTLNPEE